jgi:excisionase family DNA binding protein
MNIRNTGVGRDERNQLPNPGGDLQPLAVSPRQACRLMAIGTTRLYELIAAGEIESYRDGRARRIPMESIRARIARLLAAGGSAP